MFHETWSVSESRGYKYFTGASCKSAAWGDIANANTYTTKIINSYHSLVGSISEYSNDITEKQAGDINSVFKGVSLLEKESVQ